MSSLDALGPRHSFKPVGDTLSSDSAVDTAPNLFCLSFSLWKKVLPFSGDFDKKLKS